MSAVINQPAESYRLMTEHDLNAVLDIEYASYEFPWSEGIFHDCMSFGYSSWVTEIDGSIVAYAVMSIAVQECHILNICVNPQLQGLSLIHI